MRAVHLGVLLSVGLGVGLGCSGDKSAGPEPALLLSKAPTAAGDSQTWTTGHTLLQPLRVLVTRDGKPVGAMGVEWLADSGQGVFSPPTSITGADGIAITRWTLGRLAGTYHSRARLAGQTETVTFTATAAPNFPHQMSIAAGDGQSGPVNTTLSEPLIVMVGDEFNNPFPGAGVEWLVLSGDATLENAETATNPGGVASATVNLGPTAGPIEVKVQFPGASGGPSVTFQLTSTP